MAYIETTTNTFSAPVNFNPIKWLLRLDASFRDANHLKNTEDHNLNDMGITREQADVVFYRQFAVKHY